MGFMAHTRGMSKEEKEKAHKEYLEVKNRLIEAQKPKKQIKKKRSSSKPKNGKVVKYNICELECDQK